MMSYFVSGQPRRWIPACAGMTFHELYVEMQEMSVSILPDKALIGGVNQVAIKVRTMLDLHLRGNAI